MNLRPTKEKPVIYLVSTNAQAIDLVHRIAGLLESDSLIVPDLASLQNHLRSMTPGCIVVPLRDHANDLETMLAALPAIGIAMPVIVASGEIPVESVVKIMELGAYKILYKNLYS